MDTSHLSADELRAFWRGHLAHWRASGQSQAAYCREHGLTDHRFRYWKRCFQPEGVADESSDPGRFLPVQLVSRSATSVDSGITVRLPTGLGLELRNGFDAEVLRSVVQALSG